ncbi:ribulose-phosphate 3-epimerase [Balneicella halophila]|uniref:Ribulose-phosphate 3-epimerase n=1 Tax=Balneicella halophila TaxID=1537566 RepID=A0A7L4UP49_BALHA|nr:ribulose-phosphate 3-epimerase [Balneicella halophila]PVX50895.1 ribulose-phosphate 3-epimerase [Balneicella halophila]
MTIVAPSLLSADFMNLADAINMLNESEADWLHLDVMDGRFVPNITFGMPIISQMKALTDKPLDVHLMIVEPEKYLEEFCQAGADILTVHAEACVHLHRTVMKIKELGMKAGVSLNPHTPVELLRDLVSEIDLVLLMSVNPGFGGQSFIENTYNKTRRMRAIADEQGTPLTIEIDGGVTDKNALKLVEAGADALVAGSYVFGADDPKARIASLKV